MTTTTLNTKIGEVGNKMLDVSGLVKKRYFNAKMSDIEKNFLLLLIIISSQVKYLKPK